MGPEIIASPQDKPDFSVGLTYVSSPETPSTVFTRGSKSSFPPSPSQSTTVGSPFQSPLTDPLSPTSTIFQSKHDSQMGPLLDSNKGGVPTGLGVFHPGSSNTNSPSDPDPWWKKLLKSKWSMLLCLLIGAGGAIGHHFLYDHLHDQEAKNQEWWLRAGQAIAFVAKAGFVFAVLMAYQQVAWRAVGKKAYSVEGVDSLFGAAHDLLELLNTEAWKKSWLAMVLALYVWASPLLVIFTSATLRVVPNTKRENTMCRSIRTLNFAQEETNDWEAPQQAENQSLIGLSVSMWKKTAENRSEDNYFDYWMDTSLQFETISNRVLYGNQAIQRENAAREVCGDGWDCSTNLTFIAPGYDCKELGKGIGGEIAKLGDAEAPFDMSMLVPDGKYTFYAEATEGEYAMPQINGSTSSGIPSQDPPFPRNLGAFRTEPIIWIGYSNVTDLTKKHAKENNTKSWKDDYTPVALACEHYEVNYTVALSYTGGVQTYKVLQRDLIRKVIDTTFLRDQESEDPVLLDKTVATPEENYVLPQNVTNYRRIAAYHSIGKQFRDFLAGSIELPSVIATTKIMPTKLMDRNEYIAVPNFRDAVRNLYEDLIMSIFSDPQFLVVSWASNPSKLSGVAVGGPETDYPCVREQTSNYFLYQWQVLASVYAFSSLIALVGVASGFYAMGKDRAKEQREISFSSISEATNGVRLDKETDRGTRIRCYPVDMHDGKRVYEFRVEERGGQEYSSRSDFGEKRTTAA